MTAEMNDKLAALMDNEEASERLSMAASAEDFRAILKQYGVELSTAELNELTAPAEVDGELTEDALESVSGGGWFGKHAWGCIVEKVGRAVGSKKLTNKGIKIQNDAWAQRAASKG